ncbi:MAG: FAD-dependent oxidoreductase [Lentisphaeria bacterium]|nr:FAD-dependent oxidoreductase [Lentisphaeria bacterium]
MLRKEYVAAVCGGGIAGVAAALASARCGMNTVLIEKTILPGGLATSGLVLVYLPLCDGKGHQMIHGISEELLNASNRYGPCEPNSEWEKHGRYVARFSPGSFVLALDELLENAGVDVWLDSRIIGCTVQNGRLTEIEVANKSGTVRIGAKVFVDATGDADLCFLAGNPCRFSENSMVLWTIEHNEHSKSENDLDECSHTAIHADPLEKAYTTENLSGKMVTDFVLEGRRRYRDLLKREYAEGIADRKSHYPLTLQTLPPIRKGRCIQGCFTLDTGMEGRSFEDPVGVFGDWRCPGKLWQIPYRSLLPENLNGVIAAGRCISSIGDAWEATRVIPVAAMTGEVAGTAAAMSVIRGKTPHDLAYSELADELRKTGFRLDFPS